MLTEEQGRKLTQLARDAIGAYFNKRRVSIDGKLRNELSERRPVFVILNKNGKLRGSMGFTDRLYPLYEGTTKAAINAAFADPRFPPLEEGEFQILTISVSVLTMPALLNVRNPEDYLKSITPGRDGIMVVGTFTSGLIMPQTAIANKWNAETYLKYCCIKASLHPDSWRDFNLCRVYKFQVENFSEIILSNESVRILERR